MQSLSTFQFKNILFGSPLRKLITGIILSLILWLIASLYLLSASTALIFQNKVSWAPVPNFGYETSFIRDSKSQNLSLWFFPNSNSKEVILYLHGNAGRINAFFSELTVRANVVSPAYPGYHESEGSPSVESTYEAAELTYNWLVNTKGYSENQITILGHSMGGSPATYLASKKPNAKQLVLINTFSSVQSMCFKQYAILCVFAGDIFNSAKNAKIVTIPVRQFAYKGDLTVPFEEGKKLFTYFESSEDKTFTILDGNTHSFPDFNKVFSNIIKID